MTQEIRKIYRSRTDRVLFGVCGGLGEYFNTDPVLFRLLFVLLFFVDGTGILLYLLMIFIIPLEPKKTDGNATDKGDSSGKQDDIAKRAEQRINEMSSEIRNEVDNSAHKDIVGVLIIAFFAVLLVMRMSFPMFWVTVDMMAMAGIIIIGILIILKKS